MLRAPTRTTLAPYLGFAFFGGLWGTWGAAIPAIRDQADVGSGQLGTALLFVGAGALPAMPAAGRLVDRRGQRAAGSLILLLGVVGLLVAATGRDFLTLSIGLAALGAASGAADVAINSVAGSAQEATGRPVISRAHALFSAGVVTASLGTGVLLGAGWPVMAPFALLAAAGAVAGHVLARTSVTPATGGGEMTPDVTRRRSMTLAPLLILGALGALAFAVENGHQSWSALYLRDVLGGDLATAAFGPAAFAAVVALTRFTTGRLGTRHPVLVLVAGATLAAVGTALLAQVTSIGGGLVALAMAAAGTAVLFPTLLSVLTTRVRPAHRGTATSIVTTVAYLGFLAGPPYVGLWAERLGLPGAMTALAVLAVVLAVVSPVALRARSMRPRTTDECTRPASGEAVSGRAT